MKTKNQSLSGTTSTKSTLTYIAYNALYEGTGSVGNSVEIYI
jgi:hypothetical protein